jgi:dTDP-4-dehydrorhamnose reductase
VNASAYTDVDRAEKEPELAMKINALAPGIMAEVSRTLGAVLIHFSTDYVFDGRGKTPYTENDVPNPLNVYGRSKLMGEENIQQAGDACLILRTSWVYSLRGNSFVNKVLGWAASSTLRLSMTRSAALPGHACWRKSRACSLPGTRQICMTGSMNNVGYTI